ncbi:MAG: acyltransferase, partial [Bacteroidaceae bacterium]|nr:acyltransferase [Bacteroidaceae bacterium]
MTETKRGVNIVWIDVLRVLACFLVVFAHCTDPHTAQFDNNYPVFLQGCAMGSLVRCCVPLFVMMTGVLVIPNDMRMGDFYRKRVGRLAVPLVFWSLLTPLLYFVYINYIHRSGSMSLDLTSFSAEATINKLYTFIFNFNYDTTPFWYLYMLIGLYLIMPLLNAWLKSAERKEVKLFLKVWGVSLLLP